MKGRPFVVETKFDGEQVFLKLHSWWSLFPSSRLASFDAL